MYKILIVDDEESLCKLYGEELTDEGYEVLSMTDGLGVMERIEQDKPDLVILDIRLGTYDGLDILVTIRNTYYDLPVILCSAYSTYKDDLRSIAADYYVIKSYDLDELKNTIRMALGASSFYDQEILYIRDHSLDDIENEQVSNF